MALYAKMVNLHSRAFASTQTENSKQGCHKVCIVRLSAVLCVQHVQGHTIQMTLPPTHTLGLMSGDFLP